MRASQGGGGSSGGGDAPVDSAATLAEVLAATRALLHRLCWSDRAARDSLLVHRPAPVLGLVCDATAAFNALYERHTRAVAASAASAGAASLADGAGGGLGAAAAAAAAVLGGAPSFFARDADFYFPAIAAAELNPSVVAGFTTAEATDEGAAALPPDAPGVGAAGAGDGPASAAAARGAAALSSAAGAGAPVGEGVSAAASLTARLRSARVLFVLTRVPQAVPFRTRLRLFEEVKALDKAKHDALRGTNAHGGALRVRVSVRRDHLVEDAFVAFERLAFRDPAAIKDRLYISFFGPDVRGRWGGR